MKKEKRMAPKLTEDIIYLDDIMGAKQNNTCWLADTETFVANHYVVNLDKDVTEPHNYRDITQLLMTMGQNDTATFHINTWGGDLMTTIMLIDVIRNCQGQTYGIVTLGSSAGSIIALALDDCETVTHGEFYIHPIQSYHSGDTFDQIKRLTLLDKKQRKLMEDIYADFLTQEEIEGLMSGTLPDLTLDDVECNTRLENRRKIRHERFEKEQQEMRERAEQANKPKTKKEKIEKGV